MTRTSLARAFEVVAYWQANNEIPAAKLADLYSSKANLNDLSEPVTCGFVSACLTVNKRALAVPSIRDKLLKIDADHGVKGPFSSIYTLKALVERGERHEYIEWAIDSIIHDINMGTCFISDITYRSIYGGKANGNRGIVDKSNLRKAFGILLASSYGTKFDVETRDRVSLITSSHQAYYNMFGNPQDKTPTDISWMSVLPESGQMFIRFVEAPLQRTKTSELLHRIVLAPLSKASGVDISCGHPFSGKFQ